MNYWDDAEGRWVSLYIRIKREFDNERRRLDHRIQKWQRYLGRD